MILSWRAGYSRATSLFGTCVGASPVAVGDNFNFSSSKPAQRRGSARTRAVSSPNLLCFKSYMDQQEIIGFIIVMAR